MGLFGFLRRRKKDTAEERRIQLLAKGRIADGVIIEIEEIDDGDQLAHFSYTVNGVDFQSAELLTDSQISSPAKYAPGADVSVRYDKNNQYNAVIV